MSDLFAELDSERERIRAAIAGRDEAELAARPANGAWSVVENLRHLLFAEQAHLGRFAPQLPEFDALGLPPPGMMGNKRVGRAGTKQSQDASEVFRAWDAAHGDLRGSLTTDDPRFETALSKHLKHLRLHAGIIERLLRAAAKSRR